MTDLELAKEKLSEEGCTFAAARDGKLISSEKRGVVPLIEMLDSGNDCSGWTCADKVCGKAPAMIYVLLKVKEVFAGVMTYEAAEILTGAGIICSCGIQTDKIIRRDGKDICPMEKAVKDMETPEEAVSAVRAKLDEMGIRIG